MKTAPTISVLSHMGYSNEQIQKMMASISEGGGDVVHAAGSADDATVIAAASRGLCTMSPVQARAVAQHDAGLMRIYQFVEVRAKRYGIPLGDKRLEIREVDAALKAANVSSDDRWLFKGKLRELRLV